MINSVAEFLLKLKDEEAVRLADVDLTHGPTIGDMYEGLARELLERAIPDALGLRLLSGFITDGLGNTSGQIDCMLVRGEGTPIPYTQDHSWHVGDVIAVFEIKKRLYGQDLADAFAHLREVKDLEHSYWQSLPREADTVNIDAARRAFAETTRLVAPAPDALASLSVQDQLIYHTLVGEQLGAVRVVFGYHGFKSEFALRKSFTEFIGNHLITKGFGVGSFPQLITSGAYSLAKANGRPFSAPIQEGRWPFYFSTAVNPLLILLEYIWTRLDHDFGIGGLWGEDLVIEAPHPFLWATIEQREEMVGWNYEFQEIASEELASSPTTDEWKPAFLSHEEFVAIERLCKGHAVRLDDDELLEFLENAGVELDGFRGRLLETGLVALSGMELVLITDRCQPAILSTGEYVAGEDNTGRMTRWLAKHA